MKYGCHVFWEGEGNQRNKNLHREVDDLHLCPQVTDVLRREHEI